MRRNGRDGRGAYVIWEMSAETIFKPYINSYFGVDYKPSAESNYGGQTIADLYADCTETGLDNDCFDTLLSTQVMEHVYDTGKYVKECHRLLKKRGGGDIYYSYVLAVPCGALRLSSLHKILLGENLYGKRI